MIIFAVVGGWLKQGKAWAKSAGRAARPFLVPGALLFLMFVVDAMSSYEDALFISLRCWIWVCVTSALRTGLMMIPLVALGRFARFVLCPFWVLLFVGSIIQWYVRLNFSMNLDGGWVGILLGSSLEEMRTFFRSALTVQTCAIGCGLVALMGWTTRILWRQGPIRFRKGHVWALVALVGAYFGFHVGVCRNDEAWRHPVNYFKRSSPTINFYCDTVAQRDNYFRLYRLHDHPVIGAVRLKTKGRAFPLAVFVLGESATRNRWGLYGYGRPTTPQMAAIRDELCVFGDVVGSSSNTAETMRLLLTEADRGKPFAMTCTLPQILQMAGYRCVLLSNQTRWGMYNGVESFLFGGCETIRFLPEEGLAAPWHDDALLPFLDEEIRRSKGPAVVFLHLQGSHMPPSQQYPKAAAAFEPETCRYTSEEMNPQLNSNHYDNTIAFTDRLLGEVVKRLRKEERPTMMFYLSDHGESVDSGSWRNVADMNLWELPMICWFSPQYRAAYPETVAEMAESVNRPLQTEGLLTGLVSLFQVEGYGKPEDDFHNARYVPRKRMVGNGKVEYKRKGQK